jgi:hypothetical protein
MRAPSFFTSQLPWIKLQLACWKEMGSDNDAITQYHVVGLHPVVIRYQWNGGYDSRHSHWKARGLVGKLNIKECLLNIQEVYNLASVTQAHLVYTRRKILLQGAKSVKTEPNWGTSSGRGMTWKTLAWMEMANWIYLCEWGFHTGVVEHSSLLECNAVSLGE